MTSLTRDQDSSDRQDAAPLSMSRGLEQVGRLLGEPSARASGSPEALAALGRCHDDVRELFRFATNLDELVGPSPVRWYSLRDAVDDRRHYADRFGDEVCFVGRDASGYHLLVDTATGKVLQWHHDDDGPLLERATCLSELLCEVLAAIESGEAGSPIAALSPSPAPRISPSGARVSGPYRLGAHVRTDDVAYAAALVDGSQVLRRLSFALEARSLVDGTLLWHQPAGRGRESVAWAIPTAAGVVASLGRSEHWQLVALDPGGRERWRRELPAPGSGAVLNGALWVLAGVGRTATLRQYDTEGEVVFELDAPNGGMLCAERDGLVFAADTEATNGLYRFDPADRSLRQLLPGRLSHLDTDGTFRLLSFFGEDDYRVVDRGGQLRYRGDSRSIPVLHDGRLYLIDKRGKSRRPTCIDLATGAPRWVREPEEGWSPDEICPLGPVVAVDAHPAVWFLDPDTGETVGELAQPPGDDEITLSLAPQSYSDGVAALALGNSLYLLEVDEALGRSGRPS